MISADTVNVYPLRFLNYYDRRVEFYDTIGEYIQYLVTSGPVIGVNFNPNDGVDTELIVNMPEDNGCSYLIVVDVTGAILSRWYVIEATRLRRQQYRLILHRDLLADYYDTATTSPCFIEKATLPDSDSAIFNSENMSYDQIKTSETLLKDETGGAWVVGYIPRDFAKDAAAEIDLSNISASVGTNADFVALDGIENYEYDGMNLWDHSTNAGDKATPIICRDGLSGDMMSDFALCVYRQGTDGTQKTVYGYENNYIGTAPKTSVEAPYIPDPWSSLPRTANYWTDSDDEYPDEDAVGNVVSLFPLLSYSPSDGPVGLRAYFRADGAAYTAWHNVVMSILDTQTAFYLATYYTRFTQSLNGKTIYDSRTGITYRIELQESSEFDPASTAYVAAVEDFSSLYYSIISNVFSNSDVAYPSGYTVDQTARNCFRWKFRNAVATYRINLSTVYSGYSLTVPKADSRVHLSDSPYDMFCIPYSDATELLCGGITFNDQEYESILSGNPYLSQNVSISIGEQAGSENIYDVQLLPYCPVQKLIDSNGRIDGASSLATNITVKGYYSYLTRRYYGLDPETAVFGLLDIDFVAVPVPFSGTYIPAAPATYTVTNTGGKTTPNKGLSYTYMTVYTENATTISEKMPIGKIFWCDSSSFSFTIPLDSPIEISDAKVQSETDMYRLVSPNYSGQFEFNAAKNGGIRYFDVYCTYKPFNPYISVRPNFGRLYGTNFADGRGLICGGDFSLPQTRSTWAEYQYSNKNYENIFNRQIENMEVQNSVAREQEIWGIVGGTIQGTAMGIAGGAMIGGGIGAAVGGVAGTAFSLGAGIRDYYLSDTLRNETLDLTKDLYGYQLGNIKAQSLSLSKASALTVNNKLFPFLEYYTCPEQQKQALRDKITYNGMTVMRVGIIADYLQDEETYVKGKLIRTNIKDDYHLATALADELNKGAFMTREG